MSTAHRKTPIAWLPSPSLLFLALWSCGGADGEAPLPPTSLETSAVELRQLKGIDAVAVRRFSGPGETSFEVHARGGEIGQYPCSTCHEQALPIAEQAETQLRWAHQNIRPLHPSQGQCSTCHNYGDLNTLQLEDGRAIDFDHAYQLCARCHFEQARDWAGGAHGKRLGGWTGRRVVLNCTDCHDPHAPAFAPRMPVRGPQVQRPRKAH